MREPSTMSPREPGLPSRRRRCDRALQLDTGERRHHRHETWQLVETEFAAANVVAELLNLSRSGANLRIKNGFSPTVGCSVTITWMDGTEISGLVKWSDIHHVGIEFSEQVANTDELLHFDHLGQDFIRGVFKLQRRRIAQTC